MIRSRPFVVAAAIVGIAAGLQAQTPTAAGVDALLRGDYPRAARILTPLAETPWAPDHTAEFFLGVMRENGLGVPADPLRACALFLGAAAARDSPLGTAALGLIRSYQRRIGREAFETCNWRSSIGFGDRFEPVTFALDQEHWIAWDLKGATISYRGAEKRVDLPLASRYVRFVSIRHAELATGDNLSIRRHFIDVSRWLPLPKSRAWVLTWTLFEVTGGDLLSVTSQQLTTASGDEAPAATAQDLDALVSLRVNDHGDPEYAVLTGDVRQTAAIESDAERQAWKAVAAQQGRARQTGAERGPARTLDVHRRPALAYAANDVDGCGSVFVYGWTADRTEAIAVRADTGPLQVTTAGTFDLASPPAGLDIRLHVYANAMSSLPFCTDVGIGGLIEEVWRPVRGTMTIQLTPSGLPARSMLRHRATVRITGAQFVSPSGVRIEQTQPITLSAIVGMVFG